MRYATIHRNEQPALKSPPLPGRQPDPGPMPNPNPDPAPNPDPRPQPPVYTYYHLV